MAKGLLRFFGFLSVICGIGGIAAGILTGGVMYAALAWGVGMLLAGAPLLGFAYALELLEDIARNTAPHDPARQPPPIR